jgi:hypothetical protein
MPPVRFAEFVCCALLESINELHQITRVDESFAEKVEMVRHYAIGMKRKIEFPCHREKFVE